jgi:type II secretory pathway pseudopilin PulG
LALAFAVPGLSASIAQAEAQKQHYSVAAGSLASALNRFAQQSGVFIAGHNDLAADKRSPVFTANTLRNKPCKFFSRRAACKPNYKAAAVMSCAAQPL